MYRIITLALVTSCISPRASSVRQADTLGDRALLQAMLVPGDVYLAPRVYVLDQAPSRYWSLDVPAGVRLHGNGSVLLAADTLGDGIRLVHVSGDGILVEDLELVGSKATRVAGGQSHGLFAQDTPGLRLRMLSAHDFPGDGIALYSGVADAIVEDVTLSDNGRDGLSVIGSVSRLLVSRAVLRNNRAQQFDSEPGGTSLISDVTLSHLTVDPGASTDWGVTISGAGALAQGGPWRILDSTIAGGMLLTWARDVVIAGNIISGGTHPALEAYRTSARVDVVSNTLAGTGLAIDIAGTGSVGQQPSAVRLTGNAITANSGVLVEGALDVTLTDNTIIGTGAPGNGVALRATVPAVDFAIARLAHNTISGFGTRGVLVAGYGTSRLGLLQLESNTFAGEPTAALLDDGTHALQALSAYDNRYGPEVTSRITGIPAACNVMLMADLP